MPRDSFVLQTARPKRLSMYAPKTQAEKVEFAGEVDAEVDEVTRPFQSKFAPSDMRQLALVAHNHMKPAMKEFITTYTEILNKFRITGTQTTMRMCKTLWGEDNPKIEYGLTCTSGPLGGDAQVAALMCMEDLGGLIFFTDPLSAHPHQADIDSLIRLANCGNVIMCINPTSAMSMMHVLKCALKKGSRGMIPSFFETLESPAVPEYKAQQQLALVSAVNSGNPAPASAEAAVEDESSDDDSDDECITDIVEAMQTHQPSFRIAAPAPQAPAVRRGSTLAGVVIPVEKKKGRKKRSILKKFAQSITSNK
jgi:methylglyoxal synthase